MACEEKELTRAEAAELAKDIVDPGWRHRDQSEGDAIDAIAAAVEEEQD